MIATCFRSLLAAALLFFAGHALATISFNETEYVRSGPSETLDPVTFGGGSVDTAPLANTRTINSYSGFVELVVSGVGESLAQRDNDAFYVFEGGPPFNDVNYYQLATDTATIEGSPGDPTPFGQLAKNLIVYDVDAGVETNVGGYGGPSTYVPAYRTDHVYRFVIDVSRTQSWSHVDGDTSPLNFTVANGIYSDNTGAYRIEVYQLEEADAARAALLQATPDDDPDTSAPATRVTVQLAGEPETTIPDIQIVSSSVCADSALLENPTEFDVIVGPESAINPTAPNSFDVNGQAFVVAYVDEAAEGEFFWANAVGGTSTPQRCVRVGPDNDAWPRATLLTLDAEGKASDDAFIEVPGRARWYKFPIVPNSEATITLTDLPANYDLLIFRDINQAFNELEGAEDVDGLNRLGVEYAPYAFTPYAFTETVSSPFAFTDAAFNPFAFTQFLISDVDTTPFAFTPFAFTDAAQGLAGYAPYAFTGNEFSPFAFTDGGPNLFSQENYESAQIRSLIAVSSESGTGSETVTLKTWNNTGFFYVLVRGRNGAAVASQGATVNVDLDADPQCIGVMPLGSPSVGNNAGAADTVILWDSNRLAASPDNSPAAMIALEERLNALAARPEVNGALIDLNDYPVISALHAQADANNSCPYAENLTAAAIKEIVDSYRNPQAPDDLKYIVIVGDDNIVPFFRYLDGAPIGKESQFNPPVADATQSQAALRLNYVLGQDAYGSSTKVAIENIEYPLPDVATGRLVETAQEMITVLDAYLGTASGVIETPTTTFVSGYDFLTDAATAINDELVAATGTGLNDTLITPEDVSPQDVSVSLNDGLSWTADQLRFKLWEDAQEDDIIFLAGHFNDSGALAADYVTSVLSTELLAADIDLTNVIVYSAGCHSGYNLVNEDAVPGVTKGPDWAQAFAQKGATLVAGTGYQYGDTDFLEYGERLYLEFTRRLRTPASLDPEDQAIAVGTALVRAKQIYLQDVPQNKGIHVKQLLISTVFGLPMTRVDLPGKLPPDSATVPAIGPVMDLPAGTPGGELGTQVADLERSYGAGGIPVVEVMKRLEDEDGTAVMATFIRGPNGTLSNPAEPALPLDSAVVSVPGKALRGALFLESDYEDTADVIALSGAPAYELRTSHVPPLSDVFYPVRLDNSNFYGPLAGSGDTVLHLTPAQYRDQNDPADPLKSILRKHTRLKYQVFYSSNTQDFLTPDGRSVTPALSARPVLSGARVVTDTAGRFVVIVNVVGDPAAGVQAVFATFTDLGAPGTWRSVALTQPEPETNSTLWRGELPNTLIEPAVILQAVNGTGLVTLDANAGKFFTLVGQEGEVGDDGVNDNAVATTLTLDSGGVTSGSLGDEIALSATLETTGSPMQLVDGAPIVFRIGTASTEATTVNGIASATLNIATDPGITSLVASFEGSETLLASSDEIPFTINKAPTLLTLHEGPQWVGVDGVETGITAELTTNEADPDERIPLPNQSVFFTIEGGPEGDFTVQRETDTVGVAALGELALPAGEYHVTVRFLGQIPGVLEELVDPLYLSSSDTIDVELENARKCPTKKKWGHVTVGAFCYLTKNVIGNVTAIEGTLIVGNSVTVFGHVTQKRVGSVRVLPTAKVTRNVVERAQGDVLVEGTVNGNARELGKGDAVIDGHVRGNVVEYAEGSVIINGRVRRNVFEYATGDVILNGTVGGHVFEYGPGEIIDGS